MAEKARLGVGEDLGETSKKLAFDYVKSSFLVIWLVGSWFMVAGVGKFRTSEILWESRWL